MAHKVGYLTGHQTYGEVIAAKPWQERLLCRIGDLMDRYLRGNGPLFPKDAPLFQGNCGVVAMCMFLDKPYAEVAPILGRGRSRNWSGSTYVSQYVPCATELGFAVAAAATSKSVPALLAESVGKAERLFCVIAGHAFIIWDGLIFDQSSPAGRTLAEDRAKYRTSAYRITYMMRRPAPAR